MQTRVGLVSLLANYKFDVSLGRTPMPLEYDPKFFGFTAKGGMHLKISRLEVDD